MNADPTGQEHVLALPGAGRRVWHIPSDDDPDSPQCDGVGNPRTDYARRDPSSLLRLKPCKRCHGSDSCGRGGEGSQLAARLLAMDADDVGGETA